MVGGMHGRGMHGRRVCMQERRPLKRSVRILLLCILVKHKIYLRNLVNTSTTFYAFCSSFITKHFFEL